MPGVRRKPEKKKDYICCPRCGFLANVNDNLSGWFYHADTGALCPSCDEKYRLLIDRFMGRADEEDKDGKLGA